MPNRDLDHRMHMLEANRAAAMVMLSKIVTAGFGEDDSVVVIADTTDSVGGPMARAMAERNGRLDAVAEAAGGRACGEIIWPRAIKGALPNLSAEAARRHQATTA